MNAQVIPRKRTSNEGYAESLEALMLRRLGGRVRDLRVVVTDHGITLQGRAFTYHAKQLAQHAAMEISGLPVVSNDIEVC
ncbi:MAG: hypothetical protein KatS3mg105_3939 [Gemmatales bacterium]|nr:MAG: hypothetical protein KatS3mg105_3939 [Gemmatales bacterium]